jgi:hypothetical protein
MTLSRRKLPALAGLACLLTLVSTLSLLSASTAAAQSQVLFWERYDVTFNVETSGEMRVVETQEIAFLAGTFREGFAVIPRTNTDEIRDFSVREGDQVYRQTETDTDEPYTFVVFPGAEEIEVVWNFPETGPSTHTYELGYTVIGGIRQYPQGDELQWQAIPSDRGDFGIMASTITVNLPPQGFPIEGRIVAFSPATVGWSVPEATTVVYQPTRALAAGEGVEIALAFNPDAVTGPVPQWQQEYDRAAEREAQIGVLSGVLAAATLVAVPLGLYLLWFLAGRDPSAGVVPEYIAEPPSDLPPGVIGTLVDEQADTPDVVATVVDLARKGALTITENATQGAFGGVTRSYTLTKQPLPEGLAEYEKTLYNSLFANQESRSMESLEGSLFGAFERIRKQLYDEVVKRGLFRSNPDSIRSRYRGLGIAGIVIFGVAAFCTVAGLGGELGFFPCIPILLGLGSLALIFLAPYMPAKTKKGAEEAVRWRAFRTYLANIEKYRDLKEATDLFEKFLPYAVAFGLDRRFVAAFSKIETTPVPRWYRPTYVPMGIPGRGPAAPGAPKTSGAPMPGGLPGGAGAPAGGMPSLGDAAAGLGGGLQSFSDGMVSMLNTTARTLNMQPRPTYPTATSGGSGGSSFSGSFARTGSRGFSGGSSRRSSGGFRSSGGSRGGGFRSGGGGRRGFR